MMVNWSGSIMSSQEILQSPSQGISRESRLLTFWVGNDGVGGHGGDYMVCSAVHFRCFCFLTTRLQYNSQYERLRRSQLYMVHADLQLTITPTRHRIATIYEIIDHAPGFVDDTDVIWVWDCFQEVDIVTNELVFQWRASEHHSGGNVSGYLALKDEPNHAWDWYHMSSIQKKMNIALSGLCKVHTYHHLHRWNDWRNYLDTGGQAQRI